LLSPASSSPIHGARLTSLFRFEGAAMPFLRRSGARHRSPRARPGCSENSDGAPDGSRCVDP